jgi:hypothetical protein
MGSVGIVTSVVVLAGVVAVLALGVWAIRRQNQQFPSGFDRTGWNPDGERAGWFLSKFTWLSGGRGGW